ncbi:hypothetical protein RM652_12290 [Mammaliicoccus sciuri]|uniref:hypothetical protein n=1 Tax=Mammaliicoccus sciuri TaxID=1296 RepID=UPI0028841328|nr:hypothetical protein [Mammaliicoccus sciuri]MDT0703901.1 hypothetical protein [Mammaliicoccus sciuri]
MDREFPIARWKLPDTKEEVFVQTHVDGVVGLDDYIQEFMTGTDTGWITLPISDMRKSNEYTNSFDTSYRVINHQLIIRLNLKNITDNSLLWLPSNLLSYPYECMANTNKHPIQVAIQADGTIRFNITKYNTEWSSDDYVYQELYFCIN